MWNVLQSSPSTVTRHTSYNGKHFKSQLSYIVEKKQPLSFSTCPFNLIGVLRLVNIKLTRNPLCN